METFFENIFSFLWDICINFYLWSHSTFSETIRIVMAIIIFIIGIYASYKVFESEINVGQRLLTAFGLFFLYCISIFFMACVGFVHWDNPNVGFLGWISMILFVAFTLIWIASGITSNSIIYSLVSFLCINISILLIGEYVGWVLFLPILLLGVGGGSNFIGTFTDTHGNSYDVFRRDD